MLKFYREMLLIRRFEEKAGQLYGMGLIGGFCHLYIGQEAVVVGMQAALEEGDSVITGYRDHGHMLACGMDPKGVMAELTGRAAGIPRARAARCTCSRRREAFLRRPRHRRRAGAARHGPRPSPQVSRAMAT
jgi:pyruvate dehydrogenase E1 component alpha subunit